MKNNLFFALLVMIVMGATAGNSVASTMKVSLNNATLTGSALTFDVYMGGGSDYGLPTKNMNSANIVFEIKNGAGSNGNFNTSMGTVTPEGGNYNNYLTSVYITNSPLFPSFLQSVLSTGAFNFNITRNVLGANLDFPKDSMVKVFSVSIPYSGTITAGTRISLRTATTATNLFGSSWSTGTTLNQGFTSPTPVVTVGLSGFAASAKQANATSILAENKAEVSPNPVTNASQLQITAEEDQAVNYLIVDAAGRNVKAGQVNVPAGSSTNALDVQDLAAGIYFVRVSGTTVNDMIRITKQQ